MVKKYSTYLNESLKDKDRFTINSIQQKFKGDEFRLDYKPGCNYIKNLLYGKHILIENLFRKNNGRGEKNVKLYVMDVIRPVRPVPYNYTFIDCEGNEYEPYYASYIYYYDDKEGYEKCKEIYDLTRKEKDRKKEEIRLRYADVDPYGEEDWENESLNSSEFKNRYSFISNITFKIGDIIIIKDNLKDYVSHYGWDTNMLKCIGKFYTIKLIYRHGRLNENVVDVNEIIFYFPVSCIEMANEEILKDIYRKKEELRLKYKDVDPYGEEEWEWENESKNNSATPHPVKINLSKISQQYCDGDNNYYGREKEYENELKDLLLNKYVNFETFSVLDDDGSRIIWITDKIIDLNHNEDNSVHVTTSDGTKHNLFYTDNSIFIVDQEFVEKERLKKERLYQIHKEVDPYGEEDWENESKINENMKPRFIDIRDIFIKYHGDANKIQERLEELFLGETCVWYTMSKTLKNMTVNTIEVKKDFQHVLFNGSIVNKEMRIEIVGFNNEPYIIGYPSGEVIYLNKRDILKLKNENLVKHDKVKIGNVDYGWAEWFRDQDYHKIKLILDPTYKKPERNIIEPRSKYEVDDIVICKGISNTLLIDNRIGKILSVVKRTKRNDWNYLVEFLFNFDKNLHDGSGEDGNCWWVNSDNIAGIYHGNIQNHLALRRMENDWIEEHEIDDDYHIHQLFKNKESI